MEEKERFEQDKRIKELVEENKQLKEQLSKKEETLKHIMSGEYIPANIAEKSLKLSEQSQRQLAINELKKLSKHFVYSGDEMVSDYDLDCYPSELKEEIERRIRSLKRRR